MEIGKKAYRTYYILQPNKNNKIFVTRLLFNIDLSRIQTGDSKQKLELKLFFTATVFYEEL